MNYTLIFSKNSQIDNRNSPAGSDLTPMEYTLMMIVEEKGEGAIPGFTAGSTTIATNGEDTRAILEISLRVGVMPLNVKHRHPFLTIFLSFYSQRVQKPLFRKLYQLDFVQSTARIIRLCWFEDIKQQFLVKKFFS